MDNNERLKALTRAKIFESLNRNNTRSASEDGAQKRGDQIHTQLRILNHRVETSDQKNGTIESAPVVGSSEQPGADSSTSQPGTFIFTFTFTAPLLESIYNSIPPDDTAILSTTFFSKIHYFKSRRPNRGPSVLDDELLFSAAPIAECVHIQPQWSSDAESDGSGAFIRTAAFFQGATSASVVKVTSPEKPFNSSSPPIPSALRSVNFPPPSLESTSDESSSDELILTTRGHQGSLHHTAQSEMRMNFDPSFSYPPPPMSTNELFNAFASMNTFSVSNAPPSVPPNDLLANPGPAWNLDLLQSPQLGHIISPQEEIAVRVGNARTLAHNGYRGPFDIGRLTCLIDPCSGEPNPIAETRPDARGKMVTYDLQTKEDILTAEPSETGTAQWGRKGEFTGFAESSAASVEEVEDRRFMPTGKNAWMGVRLGEGPESVMVHDEYAPAATPSLGPAPSWMKEANAALGIPNEDDEDEEGLFEYCDLDFED
ncbi:hypothetical protein BDP81DRAFT_410288 [Colletotrichum phormii]|uniref:Uncharacterized protein n=1 Tax=Colletotrichum phormii TaxID=359342 RepID=A0AAI9ZI40_9PEZI|nr:uncharacterized protein BDP81DRAFT_410288 [Colletotrichum phormii]KAK1623995.1 hypothetical protein BDP81DRAFT_410288 [Colletotrichum phormii]